MESAPRSQSYVLEMGFVDSMVFGGPIGTQARHSTAVGLAIMCVCILCDDWRCDVRVCALLCVCVCLQSISALSRLVVKHKCISGHRRGHSGVTDRLYIPVFSCSCPPTLPSIALAVHWRFGSLVKCAPTAPQLHVQDFRARLQVGENAVEVVCPCLVRKACSDAIAALFRIAHAILNRAGLQTGRARSF